MQTETSSSSYGGLATTTTTTTTVTTTTIKSQDQPSDVDLTSLYSSIFPPKTSLCLTPYSDTTIHDPLYHSRQIMQRHQDMVNRHSLCLTRLREAAKEADALRQENSTLRSVNKELNKHLSLLIQSSVQKPFGSSDYNDRTPFEIVNGFRGLCIGGDEGSDGGRANWDEVCGESPTSVIENVDVERILLPKSISVRSNGYSKMSQAGASNSGKTITRPLTENSLNGTQKVYVRGGKKEEEPLELEVYNQGMFKTELCNKWQETGACPYGDHCQFAHGIEELRPVIRHPRYKTEVCRMVLAGGVCPYGHRCHFRHALTDQERFMGQLKPRAIKLDR